MRERVECKREERDGNLSGENSGPLESLAEQIDLGYHVAVRNHHRDRSEHGFQIVGELGTTRVSWIHSDEDAAGVHQFYFIPFEHESDDFLREGGEYGQYLLRDHRQHLDVYPVQGFDYIHKIKAWTELREIARFLSTIKNLKRPFGLPRIEHRASDCEKYCSRSEQDRILKFQESRKKGMLPLSFFYRLNSSKQPHAPVCERPENNLPMLL